MKAGQTEETPFAEVQQPSDLTLLTSAQVCERLCVSQSWLSRHRSLFQWIRIPGRGRAAEEYRYLKSSMEAYVQRGLLQVHDGGNPFMTKTVQEVAALIRSRSIPLSEIFQETLSEQQPRRLHSGKSRGKRPR